MTRCNIFSVFLSEFIFTTYFKLLSVMKFVYILKYKTIYIKTNNFKDEIQYNIIFSLLDLS